MSLQLLTREQFKSAVFQRDGSRCVHCGSPGVDAHHVVERRLFESGGYYLENGVTLCAACHLLAERTELSCDYLRRQASIEKIILPEHLYEDEEYDKWGNIILPNGQRLRGDLFYDEQVQKILSDRLHLFTNYVKHPRTYHLPNSPGVDKNSDKSLENTKCFEGREVVVTVKMDGEQTTMYHDYLHARSLARERHPSRSWVLNLHSSIAHDIPVGFRVCGENLFAKHSIFYKNLSTYFFVHSVWNDVNVCLSWDETIDWANLLGLETVEVLYRGPWDSNLIYGLFQPEFNGDPMEGFVVRIADAFPYRQFRQSVGKWVRDSHVQTTQHWLRGQPVVPNQIKEK